MEATLQKHISPPRSLARQSLGSELRALGAVIRREWVIFLRYPTWIIAMFIWPIIFPAAYLLGGRALSGPDGSGLQQFARVAGTQDFVGYVVIGTLVWMWQNMVLWNVGFALREEQLRGTLESNWLSSTWRFSFLLGSSVVQFASVAIFTLTSIFEYGLFFGVRFNGSPWLALLVFVAAIPAIYGLGFAFASLVITAKEANAFVFLVRGLVMIFCGISFPVALLPGWMQGVARWLPPTYAIHGMRLAAFGRASFADLIPDITALLLFGAFWLVAGFLLFNWMERRARQTGAIGQY